MGGAGADFTDEALVAATRAGDDGAFERLYRRYQRRIAAYVHGMVNDHGRAEDITQDVFMSALRRMRETDRPIIFKPWVYEIAKNACIDAFRRSRRAEEVSYDAEDGLAGADYGRLVSRSPSPDAAVDTRMSLDHLRGAFGGLSELHHDILVMRELEGLSYRDIGERLGMSRPAVESTLFRARRRLTEEYEELTSGERCRRIQGLIADGGRRLGVRDERKMARHVSYCQPCRRAAFAAGFDLAALAASKSLGSKVAALLPLPAFVKRRWLGLGNDGGAGPDGGGSSALGSLSANMAQYAEPLSGGWSKATAVALTVAVAGAGVATTKAGPTPAPKVTPAPAAVSGAPVAPAAAAAKAAHARAGASATSTGRSAADPRSATAGGSSRASDRRGAARRDGSSGGGAGGGAAGSSAAGSGSGHATSPAAGGGGAGRGSAPSTARTGAGSGGSGSVVGDTVKKLAPRPSGSAGGSAPSVTAPKVGAPKAPAVSTGSNAVDTVTNTAGNTVNRTTDTATGVVNKATETATGVVNKTAGTATGVVDGATGAVTGAVKQAPPAAAGAVTQATGAASGAASQATGAVTGAADAATGAATGAAGPAAGAVNQVTGAVRQATGAATQAPAPAADPVRTATGAARTAAGAATTAAGA
ncbi:MAG: hypothetical protein QOD73_2366, partial [Solirubrobacteraceae bacterium]|nr:hypothetical protein [Solirubrobacteraceae bacterium]